MKIEFRQIQRIHQKDIDRNGFSQILLIVLMLIVVTITALIGLISRTSQKARFQHSSSINEHRCRTLLAEMVNPILESEGWPRHPSKDWMKPSVNPTSLDHTLRVSFEHQSYRLRAVPVTGKTYVVTILQDNGKPICLNLRYRPLIGDFSGREEDE